jgi:hypothetical protein
MGVSERTRRRSVLLWLAAFVIAVGGGSWLVTGGPRGAPPTHSHPVTATAGPTPTPLDCASNELALVGAFNECAKPGAALSCSVSGHVLDAVLGLAGTNGDAFLLYIEVYGDYAGPGPYDLPGWQFGLGTKDLPKVAVQQDGTGAVSQLVNGVPTQQYLTASLWQSVAGVLTVTGGDGRSGTVSAILELSAGNNSTVRGSTLSVDGSWRCT